PGGDALKRLTIVIVIAHLSSWWSGGVVLLSCVALYCRLDLFLDRRQVEGSWRLHRWIFDRRLRQLRDFLLDHDEAPEFACKELVHIAARGFIEALLAGRRGTFERVLAQVVDEGNIHSHLFTRPAIGLV